MGGTHGNNVLRITLLLSVPQKKKKKIQNPIVETMLLIKRLYYHTDNINQNETYKY